MCAAVDSAAAYRGSQGDSMSIEAKMFAKQITILYEVHFKHKIEWEKAEEAVGWRKRNKKNDSALQSVQILRSVIFQSELGWGFEIWIFFI